MMRNEDEAEIEGSGMVLLVECEVCNEEYKDNEENFPQLLVCGHTFCHLCLTEWTQHSLRSRSQNEGCQIECPTCRQMTAPAGGVASLPKNFELLRLREEILLNQRQVRAREEQVRRKAEEARQQLHLLRQQNLHDQQEAFSSANKATEKAKKLSEETELLKKEIERKKKKADELQKKAKDLESQVSQTKRQLANQQSSSSNVGKDLLQKNWRRNQLICVTQPFTSGSWISPHTRYTVQYTVLVDDNKDRRKARKSILYELHFSTSSGTPLRKECYKVYRRYSDFVWLVDQLYKENTLVPSLPEKSVLKFQSHLVQERMHSLQAFLNSLLLDEKLMSSAALDFFLFATTEELDQYICEKVQTNSKGSIYSAVNWFVGGGAVASTTPPRVAVTPIALNLEQQVSTLADSDPQYHDILLSYIRLSDLYDDAAMKLQIVVSAQTQKEKQFQLFAEKARLIDELDRSCTEEAIEDNSLTLIEPNQSNYLFRSSFYAQFHNMSSRMSDLLEVSNSGLTEELRIQSLNFSGIKKAVSCFYGTNNSLDDDKNNQMQKRLRTEILDIDPNRSQYFVKELVASIKLERKLASSRVSLWQDLKKQFCYQEDDSTLK